MNLFKLKPHPFSQVFPEATGEDYDHLLSSVRKIKKLRYPVIVYQGMILDGNQRIRAAQEARIEPRHVDFTGTEEEALDVVWDLNAGRRQLTASQKAIAAAKFATLTGRPSSGERGGGKTTLSEAAKKANVSKEIVQSAKKVLEHGTKKQIEEVRGGTKTVTQATREINATGSIKPAMEKDVEVDAIGTSIPVQAAPFWNRRPEANNVLNQIRAAKGQVKKLLPDDPMWAEVNLNGVLGDLESAINRFKAAIPAYVCPYCKGVKPDGCKTCKGRGVISKFMWGMIPDEMK